jgi:hypothetical protein
MSILEIAAIATLAVVVLIVTHVLAYLMGRAAGHRALNARLSRAGSSVRV